MTFKLLSTATGILCAALGSTLVVAPAAIFWLFGIDDTESARFMSRRAAMLFLGLGTVTVLGRNAPPSPLRRSVVIGICTVMLALAALGTIEFIRGAAGPGIFVAVGGELIFAVVGLSILGRGASTPPPGSD